MRGSHGGETTFLLVFPLFMILMFVRVLSKDPNAPAALLFWIPLVAGIVVTLTRGREAFRMSLAVDDRFELTPEGLKVTRKGKSKLWTKPELIRPERPLAKAPYLYRSGNQLYFFDPRYIERDE